MSAQQRKENAEHFKVMRIKLQFLSGEEVGNYLKLWFSLSLCLGLLTFYCSSAFAVQPDKPNGHRNGAHYQLDNGYQVIADEQIVIAANKAEATNTGKQKDVSTLTVTTSLKDYEIGPEDVLEIKVWNHDDLTSQVAVSQNGDITFPLIGRVSAVGKSPAQFEREVTKRLAEGYLVNPQVTVKVIEYKSQRVYVVGYVNKPGVVPLTGPTPVVEAISTAGGLKDDAGNDVLIIRPGKSYRKDGPLSQDDVKSGMGEVIPINLANIQSGDVSKNLILINGDTVIVLKAKYFYVFGEVQRPGQYKYELPISVLQAITIGGGITSKASQRSITITRERDNKSIEKRVEITDMVEPGDIVTVPESFF